MRNKKKKKKGLDAHNTIDKPFSVRIQHKKLLLGGDSCDFVNFSGDHLGSYLKVEKKKNN